MALTSIRSFSAPGSFTRDVVRAGLSLWIADLDSKLYKVAFEDGTVQATYTLDFEPRGITYDGENLWIAQTGKVHKYDLSGNDLAERTVTSLTPLGLDWDGSNLWAIDDTSDEAWRIDRATGTVLETVSLSFDAATTPQGISLAGGFFYCVDFVKESIEKFSSDGTFSDTVDLGSATWRGLDIESDGAIWTCDYSTDTIYAYRAPTGFIEALPPGTQQQFETTYADVSGRDPLPTALQQRTPAQNLVNYLVGIYAGNNPRIVKKPVLIDQGELGKVSPAPPAGKLCREIWIKDPRDPNFKTGRRAVILGRSGGANPGVVELTLFIADNAASFVEPS